MAFLASSLEGDVLRVRESSTATVPDGRSWSTAFQAIDGALAVARPGDEVWVSRGTYAEPFAVGPGIRVLGGFAGSESDPSQRLVPSNPTILSATGDIRFIAGNGIARASLSGFVVQTAVRLDPDTDVSLEEIRWVRAGNSQRVLEGERCTVRVVDSVVLPAWNSLGDAVRRDVAISLASARYFLERLKVLSQASDRPILELDGDGSMIACQFVGNQVNDVSVLVGNVAQVSATNSAVCRIRGGSVVIDRCRFSANRATLCAGVHLMAPATATLRNSLFTEGVSVSAALRAEAGSTATFVNNTVVVGAPEVGVAWYGSGQGTFANNLLVAGPGKLAWVFRRLPTGLTAPDSAVRAPGGLGAVGNAFHGFTRWSSGGLVLSDGVDRNLTVGWPFSGEPNLGDASLSGDSPAVDGGVDGLPTGTSDQPGRARSSGLHVDIGAFETGPGPGVPPPAEYFVTSSGDDLASGLGLDQALGTLQEAVWRTALAGGGVVWVAPGRYRPDLFLPPGVSIFAWTNDPSRIPVASRAQVEFDGGGIQRILFQSAGLLEARTGRPANELVGIRFMNGQATSLGGGAALVSALGFTACAFESNSVRLARANGFAGDPSTIAGGGAVLALQTARIDRCLFVRNAVTCTTPGSSLLPAYLEGGAVQVRGDAWIRDSLFLSNNVSMATSGVGRSFSGALGIEHRGKRGSLENNTFIGNTTVGPSDLETDYSRSAVTHDGLDGGNPASVLVVRNNLYAFNSGGFSSTTPASASSDSDVQWRSPGNSSNATGLGLDDSDPLYRPWSNSDLLDAGHPDTESEGRRDFAGAPRRVGPRVGVGAFEVGVADGPSGILVVRVLPSGDDSRDGSSWTNAVRSLGRALAMSRNRLTDVWVGSGGYGLARVLVLPDGVRLLGGFAGNETTESGRDWISNPTVLRGDRSPTASPRILEPLIRIVSATQRTTVSGFDLRQNSGFPAGGIWLTGSARITHNQFSFLNGTSASSPPPPMASALYCDGAVADIRLAENLISTNGTRPEVRLVQAGILSDGQRRAVLANNTFANSLSTRTTPIVVAAGYRTTIANNLFPNPVFLPEANSSTTVRSNAFWSPGELEPGGLAPPPAGSRFVDGGDGSVVEPGEPDLLGGNRVRGLRVDIGAVEHGPAVAGGLIVRIQSPTNDATAIAGFPFEIRFDSSPSGPAPVLAAGWQLRSGTNLLASGSGAAGTVAWTPSAAGHVPLVMRVLHRDGGFSDSDIVGIEVVDPPPVFDSLRLSPRLGRFDRLPGEVRVEVAGSDNLRVASLHFLVDGVEVDKVDFSPGVFPVAATFRHTMRQAGPFRAELRMVDSGGRETRTNLAADFRVGGWEFLAYRVGTAGSLNAINERGVAVGSIDVEDDAELALPARIERGRVVPLGPTGREDKVLGVNGQGVAVGSKRVVDGFLQYDFPMVYSGGNGVPLSTNVGVAHGINDAGEVVGSMVFQAGDAPQAFRWHDGVLTRLDTRAGAGSAALAINNRGVVAGHSQDLGTLFDVPVLWRDGRLEALPVPSRDMGQALALNDEGTAVGTFGGRAVVWRNGVMEDLGPGEALAVGPTGCVVGYLRMPLRPGDVVDRVPFLERGRGIERLTDLLPAAMDGIPLRITGVNGSLQMSAHDGRQGYLLTPSGGFSAGPFTILSVGNEAQMLRSDLRLVGPSAVLERSENLRVWSPLEISADQEFQMLVPRTNSVGLYRIRVLEE